MRCREKTLNSFFFVCVFFPAGFLKSFKAASAHTLLYAHSANYHGNVFCFFCLFYSFDAENENTPEECFHRNLPFLHKMLVASIAAE